MENLNFGGATARGIEAGATSRKYLNFLLTVGYEM